LDLMVDVRDSDRPGTESGHVSVLRMVVLARPLSLTAALSTLSPLPAVGPLVPTGHPLGMVLVVGVAGALAAFLVSMPVEARFAKRGQLLAQVAEELAGRGGRPPGAPAALRDPMAMLAEGFNDALAQVEDRLLGNAVQ